MTKPILSNPAGTFSTQNMLELLRTDLGFSPIIDNESSILLKHPIDPIAEMCFEVVKIFHAIKSISLPIAVLKQPTFPKEREMYMVDLKKGCNFSIDQFITVLKYPFTDKLYYGVNGILKLTPFTLQMAK